MDNVLIILLGDSKYISGQSLPLNLANWLSIFFFSLGKKPLKVKFSAWKVARTKLAIGADGPGKENTLKLFSKHSFTRSAPGSEISGVPESVVTAIEKLELIFFIIPGILFLELNLWNDCILDFIPYFDVSFFVTLVSSLIIKSTEESIFNDLIVISDKFPIGVGTI